MKDICNSNNTLGLQMISNEKYCGKVILIKTLSDNSVVKKRIVNNGRREFYKMIESHPLIISREASDRVQAEKRRSQRSKSCKAEQAIYLPERRLHDV